MEGVIPERLANLLYLIPPLGAELAEPFRHHVFHCHTITSKASLFLFRQRDLAVHLLIGVHALLRQMLQLRIQ